MANPSDEATPGPSPSDDSATSASPSDTEHRDADPQDAAPGEPMPRRHEHDTPSPGDGTEAASPDAAHVTSSAKVLAEPGPSRPRPDKHALAEPAPDADPYHQESSETYHDSYHEDHHAVEEEPASDGHEEESDPYHGHHRHHHATEEATEEEPLWSEEDGGGPVKSFLEHLEDFRWVIIRCLASLIIGMVICLVAGPVIVKLLKEPLEEAQQLVGRGDQPMVLIQSGTNRMVLNLPEPNFGPIDLSSNRAIKLVLAPVQVGTNLVLGMTPAPLSEEEIPPQSKITLKNFGPLSGFVVALKVALFGGIGLASPFLLFFIGHFIVPALHKKEKKYLYRAVAIGSLLFMSGVLFCYFFMLKVALNASVKFSEWMSFEADIWRAEDYISFVVKFMLGMGLSFELPVVLLTLVKLDLIDYPRMVKFRPYWVVVNMVIASMLTPPDPFSMLLMALPMQVLFEISLLIARSWWKKDQKRLAAEAAA